jgi:hypothetical protein
MPEEHMGQVGFEHAWKELLQRARHAGEPCDLVSTAVIMKLSGRNARHVQYSSL